MRCQWRIFPTGLIDGTVRDVLGELQVKERKGVVKEYRAPVKAIFSRTAVTTLVAIFHASFRAHFLGEERC